MTLYGECLEEEAAGRRLMSAPLRWLDCSLASRDADAASSQSEPEGEGDLAEVDDGHAADCSALTSGSASAAPRPSALDPSAPEFVPSLAASRCAADPRPSRPSVVFSGGGDFLSKYSDDLAECGGSALFVSVRRRLRAGLPSEETMRVYPMERGLPEKLNIQLNRQLVMARTVDKVLQLIEEGSNSFNDVNRITAVHRLATLASVSRRSAVRRDTRFKQLLNRLMDTVKRSPALSPQDLSNVAWALTKLGVMNAAMFACLAEHIAASIASFEPVNLSMTLWAFARSGYLDERLFRAVAEEMRRSLPNFQPQQIANTAWALAKSGLGDADLFDCVAKVAIEKLADFKPMNFSMLVYAFALAQFPSPNLFEEVGRRCTVPVLSAVRTAVPHLVTNLAVAYASDDGSMRDEVFEAVAEVAMNEIGSFRPQQIAALAQAFAKAGVAHEKLFETLTGEVCTRATEFRAPEMQDLLCAYERLGISAREIDQVMGSEQPEESMSQAWVWLLLSIFFALLGALAIVPRASDTHGRLPSPQAQ